MCVPGRQRGLKGLVKVLPWKPEDAYETPETAYISDVEHE